ncbi:Cro/Cl family transcriptional regulator [Gallibacterium genomosp. 3]|uniref:Cro/Cl family transcriptional regulator n=1 Tax=Gallibacterium genomosp. 3 TaxID=505345 RepID=A0A1A7PXP8_9PAST|nr:helix-turn-helix domain-containing protein [Gallibacterium genomosp. 3]OBX05925.1 Cro/Cl family transcriptional regulator [Gallibacterium genomosp. 3]
MKLNIEKAVFICGSKTKLAEICGVTSQAVSKWTAGKAKISIEYIPGIIQATNGEVTARDLRPDVDWDTIKSSL